jgi:hypothetical protein
MYVKRNVEARSRIIGAVEQQYIFLCVCVCARARVRVYARKLRHVDARACM